MDKLKIEYVDINNIKPYSKNAKRHPKKQIEQIKKSISLKKAKAYVDIYKKRMQNKR